MQKLYSTKKNVINKWKTTASVQIRFIHKIKNKPKKITIKNHCL